jgi:hypothetical protein
MSRCCGDPRSGEAPRCRAPLPRPRHRDGRLAPTARREYLTGFHKRKQQRRKDAIKWVAPDLAACHTPGPAAGPSPSLCRCPCCAGRYRPRRRSSASTTGRRCAAAQRRRPARPPAARSPPLRQPAAAACSANTHWRPRPAPAPAAPRPARRGARSSRLTWAWTTTTAWRTTPPPRCSRRVRGATRRGWPRRSCAGAAGRAQGAVASRLQAQPRGLVPGAATGSPAAPIAHSPGRQALLPPALVLRHRPPAHRPSPPHRLPAEDLDEALAKRGSVVVYAGQGLTTTVTTLALDPDQERGEQQEGGSSGGEGGGSEEEGPAAAG